MRIYAFRSVDLLTNYGPTVPVALPLRLVLLAPAFGLSSMLLVLNMIFHISETTIKDSGALFMCFTNTKSSYS